MRQRWIGGNWKMHKTIGEALALVQALKDGLPDSEAVEVVIAPPFTALAGSGAGPPGNLDSIGGPKSPLGRPGGLYR